MILEDKIPSSLLVTVHLSEKKFIYMNDLMVISEIAPQDTFNGGHLRLWNLLNKGDANLLCFSQIDQGANDTKLINQLNWKKISILNEHSIKIKPITHFNLVGNRFFKQNKPVIDSLLTYIKEHQITNKNTAIIIYGYEMALIASQIFESFIFDGCDSMSLYYYRRSKSLNIKQYIKKINSLYMSVVYQSLENYIARHAALYLVTSQLDREWILNRNQNANIIAIGCGTDWLNDPPIKDKKTDNKTNLIITFHGGMTWEPNRSSALYLIREVFPLVRAVYPSATLRIAGAPIFAELASLKYQEGVEICGFVDDIREWLAECDVYAMPMLQGSGVKNKLIEAMAAGLPIVTNSMGAEALPDGAKSAIVIADGSQAIADAIIYLFQNPERRLELRQKARLAAEKYFRWETLSEQYMKAIAQTRKTEISVKD
jgi:glycosyltransferase involved in cell wall biosynthesis